ncbi:MAG: hypothetical protein ABIQ73_14885 [Acidimicrobiales bacterium]
MKTVGIEFLQGEPAAVDDSLSSGCKYRRSSSVTHFQPDQSSLWLSIITFDDGGELEWSVEHGDEALYVLEGSVSTGGLECPAGTAVIIESDAKAATVVLPGTRVAHFGPCDPSSPADGPLGAPHPDGHRIHVIGPRGRWATSTDDRAVRFYSDSTCATCRVSLFYVGQRPSYRSPSHIHSQDELTLVLTGSLRIGRGVANAGEVMAVAAHQRYSFEAAGPWSFLTYRRDASFITRDPKSAAVLEKLNPSLEEVGDVLV